MNRRIAALFALLAVSVSAFAFPVYYKEQYYKLYHEHYIQYPDDIIENIYYLEQAKKADFCNPLYALAKIEDPKHWERYRYLLDMHLDLMLIKAHMALGQKFDKQVAYFYNAPWKDQNLDSLKTAETSYEAALAYWPEAKSLALKAMTLRWTDLEDASFWIDEAYRIEQGQLDYEEIINTQLTHLRKVRADFEKMNGSTY